MIGRQSGSTLKIRYRWPKIVTCFFASIIPSTSYSLEQNATVIGRSSLVHDCYIRSQQATLQQSANRTDLDVCNRAIADGAVLKKELAASYSNRGVLHMAMQNYSQAYKDYDRALKIDAELAEAYINRGNLWFAVEQFDRAISDYGSALEYGTDKKSITFLNRGLAFEYKGDLDSAKSNYQASLQEDPDFKQAQDKLDRLNSKLNASENE